MILVHVEALKNLRNVVESKSISASQIKKLLPKRSKSSNKTEAGKVLIIGGGRGLYGAGILSALASTKSGAGYTHLMTDLTKFPWLHFPDFIIHPIKLSELKNKKDFSIGIGPGLGINNISKKLLMFLIKNNYPNVVVDADALTLIAHLDLFPLPSSWIMTPHEGEMARLLKMSSGQIKKNREEAIQKAFNKFHCTILLKGSDTLIISPELNKVVTIKTGTPALSKAGTGDVLLGMIAAFKGQGLTSSEACIVSTYIHGITAINWEHEGNDKISLRPTDIVERLPKTIFEIRHQA